MTNATELERLAEADGATLLRSATGAWWAKDRDGITVVRGALSRAEAARLYCEDKRLAGSSPAAILEFIRAQYGVYADMPEFREGFEAYQAHGAHRQDPDYDGVAGQAWDRGANAAMEYARVLAHLDAHPDDAQDPSWLARFLRGGR